MSKPPSEYSELIGGLYTRRTRSSSAPNSRRITSDTANTSRSVERPPRSNDSAELLSSDTSATPEVSLVNNTLGNALKPFANILHFSLRTGEPDDDVVTDRSRYDKEHDKCRRYRRAGTKFFRHAFYYEALVQYSESLKHAFIDHEDFPRTCNKRSVVLYFLGFYKECLADLDMLARAPYDFRDESDERELRRRAATEKLKDQIVLYKEVPPLKSTDQSVQIKNCCDSVRLVPKKGSNKKTFIALKDLTGGHVVLTEKPYISGPILDETLMCWDCMDVVVNPIPCDSCSLAAYCSNKCKKYSWERYHEYECQLLSLMKDYYFEYSAAIRTILSVRDYDLSLDYDGLVDSGRFKDVFNTNDVEVENLTEEESEEILWVAEELYEIVTTRTNFLSNVRGTNLTKNEKCFMFKGMILKTLLITKARSYKETEITRYVGKKCFFKSMYSSIFPVLSYIEHSCTPNSCVSIQGRTARVISIEPIPKGEPITVCYSHLFTEKPKEERQLLLKELYNMTCSCAACVYCWPLLNDLPNIREADTIRFLQEIERGIPLYIDSIAVMQKSYDKLNKLVNYKWTKPSRAYGIYLKLAPRIYDLMNVPTLQIDFISRFHPNPLRYLDCRHLNTSRGLKMNPRQRKRELQMQQQQQQPQQQQ